MWFWAPISTRVNTKRREMLSRLQIAYVYVPELYNMAYKRAEMYAILDSTLNYHGR